MEAEGRGVGRGQDWGGAAEGIVEGSGGLVEVVTA